MDTSYIYVYGELEQAWKNDLMGIISHCAAITYVRISTKFKFSLEISNCVEFNLNHIDRINGGPLLLKFVMFI